MAALNFPIVAKDLRKHTSVVDPIPAAWYEVVVETAEFKHNKVRTWISLCYRVDSGPYDGAKIFSCIMLTGVDARTQEVTESILAVLMDSLNLKALTDSDELIGAKAVVRVAIKDDERFYKRNEVNFVRGRLAKAVEASQAEVEVEDEEPKVGWLKSMLRPAINLQPAVG